MIKKIILCYPNTNILGIDYWKIGGDAKIHKFTHLDIESETQIVSFLYFNSN
jgi:hypothetical protein